MCWWPKMVDAGVVIVGLVVEDGLFYFGRCDGG